MIPRSANRPVGSHRAAAAWALLAVFVVQCALVAHAFPWREVLSATPILNIDHPFHLYQIAVASALADQGRLTGYDPFFAAGYVGGVTFNGSAKAPALLAWLLHGSLSELQTYKLFIVTVGLTAPLAVAFAAALCRLKALQVLLCGAFAIALWWASGIHWYYGAGMVSFVAVSFYTIPFCVLVGRLVDAPYANRLVPALGVVGALLFMMHPFFVIAIAFFSLGRLAIVHDWRARFVLAVRLGIVGAICLIPNLPWLLAMRGQITIGGSEYSVPYQMLVDSRLVWMELLGITSEPAHGAKINVVLAILAVISFRDPDRSRRSLCLLLTGTWAALVLFAAFGAELPFIGSVQPNRFSTTAYLFLVIPAAIGAEALIAFLRGPRTRRWFAALVGAGLVTLVGAAVANEVRREVSYGPWGRYGGAPPEVKGLGPKGRAALDWLKTTTTPEGRVLFETSFARVHDGGHIVGYLQLLSGREFIGGPYNNFFAGTRDGWMFGKPMASIEPAQFLEYLRLYNVGWIIVHSDIAKRYLRRMPDRIVAGPAFEGLETFVVRQDLTFIEEGQANVRSVAYGKLVVDEKGPPGAPFVLKYHFLPGLRSVDGSEVRPVFLMDDPTPFVRVVPRGPTVELVR